MGLRPGQQGRAFVDLVEGVGADDGRAFAGRVDDGLGQGKQRLSRAIDRQDLCVGVQAQTVAGLDPLRTGLAQGRFTGRGRVGRQAAGHRSFECVLNERWCGVFGLTNAQTDGAVRGRGRGLGKQLFESLKRVGLQGAQKGVHWGHYPGCASACSFRVLSTPGIGVIPKSLAHAVHA